MGRLFTGWIILGLSLGVGVAADEPKSVVLRWHGQSFFDLQTSKGTRIVFDPHAIEAFGRPTGVKADLILLSHNHNDHTQVGVVENYQKAKIVTGLKPVGKKLDWNIVDQKFKDVRIRSVGVYHDTEQGLKRGKNTVFIVEADGMRIVHLGDLGHVLDDQQVKAIGEVDVLLIPVGGVYTLNGSDAKQVVEQLKPTKYIIPMHYGTKGFDDLLPVDEFLEDQKKENVKRYELTNKLVIESDFKPKEPIIAVLNWK
ncbi:MAG TPA: MBL fold metallo-hydrolase [Gemmataceae bacterium]|nr:MBL fold metallo-hydrolase [Gemmataceae bacterium]